MCAVRVRLAGLSDLLHARGKPNGVPLRCVVHAQVVTNLADDHLARIDAHPKGSMELAEQLDPEEWSAIMQRFFRILAVGVERFEGRSL